MREWKRGPNLTTLMLKPHELLHCDELVGDIKTHSAMRIPLPKVVNDDAGVKLIIISIRACTMWHALVQTCCCSAELFAWLNNNVDFSKYST